MEEPALVPPAPPVRPCSEVAVARIRLVDPWRCTARDHPSHEQDELLVALIARDVDDAAGVDVGRPRPVHMRRAVGIITAVEGRGSGLDDHEAGALAE